MQLSAVRVFVDDIAKAKSFYSAVLGLRLEADDDSAGYCVFNVGNTDLVVESVPADAPDDERILVGRFTGLSFTVQDIQKQYTQLLASGVRFTGTPERQVWGGTLATFADPSGNELQLVQHP